MKVFAPDYYRNFACIAGNCRHSCCVGWEIDVDASAYARYQTVDGEFGERLRRSVRASDEGYSFCLDKRGRCPFLNRDGLCDIIRTCGEEMLCDICTEHPRFYHFWSDHTEVGLGLCCEEAARLLLAQTHTVALACVGEEDAPDERPDEREVECLQIRAALLAVAQDRTRSVRQRADELLARSGADIFGTSGADWAQTYRSLERLDAAWENCLDMLAQSGLTLPEGADTPDAVKCEQLLCYFLARHIPNGREDGRYAARTAFAVLGAAVVASLAASGTDWTEAARLYSSEIEYSEDNTETLLSLLEPLRR